MAERGIVASLLLLHRRDLSPTTAWGLLQSLRSVYSPISLAGTAVRPDTAMRCAAVFACVRVIAETVASLPLPVYRRLAGGGKERAPMHPLYRELHDQANPEMTAMELREALVGHACLWGQAYAEIELDGAGNVVALWPLRPDRTRAERDEQGRIWYVTEIERLDTRLALPAYRVWHTQGFMGLSPIAQAREAIGLALAAEEYGARFFSNDSRPGGVLKSPKVLSKEAAERLKASWEAAHSGLSKAHRVAVLEEGVEWQQIGIPPEDAQYLETRKYQTTEIARIFRVPPHMIADLDRATFSNIEQQSIEFVVHCIRPWLVRFEQSIKRDLFGERDRAEYFAEHVVDGLLRGDVASRYQAYAIGRQWGWLSADDIRELENMNPLPDGSGRIYLTPMNMIPAGQEGQQVPPQPAQRSLQIARVEPADLRATARAYTEARRRIARSYRRLIVEASERILRREEHDVMEQAERLLGRRDAASFQAWLAEFYQGHQGHPEFVQRAFLPVFLSLADHVAANAAEQVRRQAEDLDEFMRDYTAVAANRYVQSSLGQLREVMAAAQVANRDIIEALQERFDEWRETRPGKLAMTHTVRASNAVTHETWRRAGVQRIAWVAHGKSCPYCSHLHGRVVEIVDTYAREGEEMQPDGAESTLVVRRDTHHPPLHLGCDCGIEPR